MQDHFKMASEVLKDLLSNLIKAAPRWYLIGTQLKIPPYKLQIIESDNHGESEKCLTKMLEEFLKNEGHDIDESSIWQMIVDALKKIRENDLAREIEETFKGQYLAS